MRPEVYKTVVKWWKILGYPFNNKKYLAERENELEIDLADMKL